MTDARHGWRAIAWRSGCALIAGSVVGCARLYPAPALATLPSRILPPPVVVEKVSLDSEVEATESPSPAQTTLDVCDASAVDFDDPKRVWPLVEAIDYAQRNNPRLKAAIENIGVARGGRQAAFAPFLPSVISSVKYIASASEVPGFSGTFVPYVIGFGPGIQSFDLSEMQVQWTIWDFGRTLGRYEQAVGRMDVAQLQAQRARQTIAFDVAAAYLQVLFTQAMQIVQQQAVVQAEAILRDAKDFYEVGVVDKDGVLRAEVQLAEARQNQVAARSAEQVAVSSLNLAMGRNVSASTQVLAIEWEPPFDATLEDGLRLAVDNRREIQAARMTIAVAQQGHRAAQGEFLPKVFVRGVLAHTDGQGIDVGNVQIGGIHVEQGLFEGGRRAGEAKAAKASVRVAEAQAQVVCDNIAFEVNQAYRAIADARQRIELSRASVTFAEENLRIVVDKYKTGDRMATDVVDAQTTMTRASQSRWTALYDYQTALVRLEYATGVPFGSLSGLIAPPAKNENNEDKPPASLPMEPIVQEEIQP